MDNEVPPFEPRIPPNPNGRRYTIAELRKLGETLPYIFCYVNAFKTPAFEFGIFRPGSNTAQGRVRGGRTRASSLTANLKPSHSGEHCNYSDAQIVAAGKPFDEEGFKQILSEDALKAWNSGTKALIHPRSGEKALKAFKEIGTKISKKERDVSFGSKSTIESLKSFDSGHHRPEQHAQSSRSQAGGTPNKTNALYMTDPATGKHYLVGQAPVPSTPQQFVRNDVGSPLMVPENGSLYQSAASIMQQPHFAANTTLMDPRNIPGLFGRMPVTHSPSVRPDPYSQAQLYGPTFHTPHILPGTQITPQIGWMTGVISVGPNGLPVAGPPPNADAVMRARLSAGSIMPTQSGNGYLSPYNVEELHREANRIALRVEEEKIRNTRRF